MDLFFDSLNYVVPLKKEHKASKVSPASDQGRSKILNNVSGYFKAGTLNVIMGSSGAGKTSLIDILAGRQKSGKLSGSIGLKTQDNSVVLLQTEYGKQFWKSNSAYVMQDDVFLGNLTVYETLSYAYELKVVDNRYDRKEKDARITAILKALKLEKVKISRVGDALKRGISGGETRRLSIAVELVTKPGLLFLDEPTSGLDSVNALNVIKAVKLLCQTYNTTIVCTIHQPSSTIFQMFDNLLILDGGKIVYFGGALASIEYFKNKGYDCPIYMNPAEFILDVVLSADNSSEVIDVFKGDNTNKARRPSLEVERGKDKSKSDVLAVDYEQSKNFKDTQSAIQVATLSKSTGNSKNSVDTNKSMLKQTWLLIKRTWINTTRDTGIMYVRTLSAWGIALLVGLIFFQMPNEASSSRNRINALLFLMCVFSLFCLPAISKIIEDRLLFQRERASGAYSTVPYWFATFIVEIPILLLIAVGYGSIVYYMCNFTSDPLNFVFFTLTIFLVINVGFSLSQAIASFVKSSNMAIAVYMIILTYSLLLGGFIIKGSDLPDQIQWALRTSYFFYGFEAISINEFKGKTDSTGFDWGTKTLEEMGMDDGDKWIDFAALWGWFIGFRVLSLIGLKYFHLEVR